jgi:hypothetical protein
VAASLIAIGAVGGCIGCATRDGLVIAVFSGFYRGPVRCRNSIRVILVDTREFSTYHNEGERGQAGHRANPVRCAPPFTGRVVFHWQSRHIK